jgi:AcrR family transcriptional regulator
MPASPSDPRILRSRSALEAALRELIAERELHQISVSDLTKRAGVDRSTFYEHYTGVDDLAAAACTSLFDELVTAVRSPAQRQAQAQVEGERGMRSLIALFDHVGEHAAVYRALLGARGSARVINHVLQRFVSAVHGSVNAVEGEAGGEGARAEWHGGSQGRTPRDPFAVLTAGAVLGTIIDWLNRDCADTSEEMSAAVWPYLHASAAAASSTPSPR